MNDDQFNDLKQFIASTVSQTEERLRREMSQGFQAVRQEMSDGFLAVDEAIDEIHKQLDEQKQVNVVVDKRLAKLEHPIA